MKSIKHTENSCLTKNFTLPFSEITTMCTGKNISLSPSIKLLLNFIVSLECCTRLSLNFYGGAHIHENLPIVKFLM